MQSQGDLSKLSFQEQVKKSASNRWESLSDKQKAYAKRAWSVITYKWRWQIAMNIPYLLIFLLDRSIPAVHQFDIQLLSSITSKIPIPAFISSMLGLG